MYGYKWIDGENGIFKLDISVSVQKEIRPVFKEELDFFEMYKVWEYPDTDAPLLWAEGVRKYVLNGEVIAEAKGGSFYEKPKIVIKNTEVKKSWIDIARIVGPIVERDKNSCKQIIKGKAFDFVVSDDGSTVTYSNYSGIADLDAADLSLLEDSISTQSVLT